VGEPTGLNVAKDIAFEAFGVRVRVSADTPEILERIPGLLPPGSRPCSLSAASESFGVRAEGDGSYRFERGDSPVTQAVDFDFAVMMLESQLRMYVGLNAPDMIFVHAGAVAHNGRAIVMPGLSFAGKTTLVLALVRAGATYYSDDFALIDTTGLVHPYPKPLSVRDHQQVQNDHDIERFGGIAGDKPLRICAVVFTGYRPGADWTPTQLSPGRGVLAMLANTLAARPRSQEVMQVISRAIDGAVLLEGDRGEASELVGPLLEAPLDRLAAAVTADAAR
jgi:hypothetical protein